MKKLVKKLKGLNISLVTGKEPADQVEEKWMSTAKTVRDNRNERDKVKNRIN